MQVNVTTTKGVIQELENQRNQAHSRAAGLAGANAELAEALNAASERIKALEAKVAEMEAIPVPSVPEAEAA